MIIGDVCAALEQWAPPALAYDWDRAGLSIGSTRTPLTGVLVALSVTPETLKAAQKAGANLIVSHHPVLWEPLKHLRTDDPVTRFYLDVAQAGIACYSAHTNLDVAPGGVNDILADRLGLTETRPLFPATHVKQFKLVTFVPESHVPILRDAVCAAGAGRIGNYTHCTFSGKGYGTFLPNDDANPYLGERNRVNEEPERRFEVLVSEACLKDVIPALKAAHPYEEVAYDLVCLHDADNAVGLGVQGTLPKAQSLDTFAKTLCKTLDVSHIRVVGTSRRKIRTVAVLGGAGGSDVPNIPDDVDVYITGDVDYHDALAAQHRGLIVIDAGHAPLEKWAVPAIADYLKIQLQDIPVTPWIEPEIFRIIKP